MFGWYIVRIGKDERTLRLMHALNVVTEGVIWVDIPLPTDGGFLPSGILPMKTLPIIIALPIAVLVNFSISQAQTSPHGDLRIACTQCHTTTAWKPVRSPLAYDHDSTGFPLRDQHAGVPCIQCHKALVFAKAPTRCANCHQDVHRGELGVQCERCHSSKSWLVPDMRQRHVQTRFPLMGPHMTVPCQGCHVNQQKFEFVNIPVDCYGCHRADYDATTAPAHRAAGLGTNCIQCHTPTALGWPTGFDHSTTGFALIGAHATTPCTQCHAGGRFKNTPTQCDNCHDAQFLATSNPSHTAQGFSKDCQSCHTSLAWQPATFDHSKTNFPLTGAHIGVVCASCHTTMPYASAPTTCVGCHQRNYNATTNPPHTGFSTDCTTCHSTSAWQPATFDHAKSSFPLTGAHASVPCTSCHANNNFTSAPTACVGCHQADFNAAATPPHAAAGFSSDCTTCHTTTAWSPSTFNHGTTQFALTGAHASVTPCTACHTVSPWSSQSTNCYSCHTSDYNNTNNPVHSTAGFPTTCATCHTTTAWTGATFNHTWFPTSHGNAGGTCSTCHLNASDYSQFTCMSGSCHPQSTTNSRHTGVNGYQYVATACYSCHPNGRGG